MYKVKHLYSLFFCMFLKGGGGWVFFLDVYYTLFFILHRSALGSFKRRAAYANTNFDCILHHDLRIS